MHFYGPLADTKVVAYDFIELPFGDSENDLFFTGRQRIIDFSECFYLIAGFVFFHTGRDSFFDRASKRSGLADF